MSTGGGAAAAAAAAAGAAAIANAVKASGVIVRVNPGDFLSIVKRAESPLVVHAQGGFVGINYQYLMGYKGLAFFTKSSRAIELPEGVELVKAEKIWIPG